MPAIEEDSARVRRLSQAGVSRRAAADAVQADAGAVRRVPVLCSTAFGSNIFSLMNSAGTSAQTA